MLEEDFGYVREPPVWSPDGQYVAFTSDKGQCLYVVDVESGRLTLLASDMLLLGQGIEDLWWLP